MSGEASCFDVFGIRGCVRALALIFAVAGITTAVEAKPTGWQSPSELMTPSAEAWRGYGDTGYAGRPITRKTKSAIQKQKSKALKAYAGSYGLPKKAQKLSGTKQYAALHSQTMTDSLPAKSLTGGGVRWTASASCLNGALVSVVGQVASYGHVTVNSTCRSRTHNAKVGGAKHSHHLTGDAVDFRVRGNIRAAYAFLRSHGLLGGVKHYGGGLFHVDTGPKRAW